MRQRHPSPKRDKECPCCGRRVAYLRRLEEYDATVCRTCFWDYLSRRRRGIESHDTACMLIRMGREFSSTMR